MKNINIKAMLVVVGFWAAVGGLMLTLNSLSEQQVHILGKAIGYSLFVAFCVLFSALLYELLSLTKFRKD
jgi:hypothetical protein